MPGNTNSEEMRPANANNHIGDDAVTADNVANGNEDEGFSAATEHHSDPTEFLKMRPKKSILKAYHPQPQEIAESVAAAAAAKALHFDEMNILATHHPPDKDYGHMQINEPKTPYHIGSGLSDTEEDSLSASLSAGINGAVATDRPTTTRPRQVSLVSTPVDAEALLRGLTEVIATAGTPAGVGDGSNSHRPHIYEPGAVDDNESADEDDESIMSAEQLQRKREFAQKRRLHYDEGAAFRRAKQTATKDDEE